jgi:hypothetical protein
MQKDLDQLVSRVRKAHGADLVSVVLYGSAAAGEHHPEFSDINILCVLTEVTPVQLMASAPVFRWWHECGHPSPLLLSEHEVETSTDCFAIEFHDMQQSHRILYGKDLVAGLMVDRTFYRAQVERELRAKLLRLRTKAAPILTEKEALGRLLADSVSTFCVLFRHAVLLHGVEAGPGKRAAIEGCGKAFGMDTGPFLQLLDAREEKTSLKSMVKTTEPASLLAGILRELTIVINAVDRLEK